MHAIHCQKVLQACKTVASSVLQVVVTDVEECMEALHENVTANLPSHCKLRPDIWRQPSSDEPNTLQSSQQAEPAGASIPQQASSQVSERQAHILHDATNKSSRTLQDADANSRTASIAQQNSTDVSVAELDWAQDPCFLSPPFEVVLIADVVS